MPDALPPPRTVDVGRVVQFRVDARDGRQVHDHPVSQARPDVAAQVEDPPVAGIAQEADLLHPHGGKGVVHHAAGAEHLVDDAHHDDRGKEVGHVQDGLGGLLQLGVVQLVEQHRKHNGEREADQQAAQVQHQGILDGCPELPGPEGFPEILQPHPGTGRDPLEDVVLLERDHQPAQGQVTEHYNIYHGDQQHDIQRQSPPDGPHRPGSDPCFSCGRRHHATSFPSGFIGCLSL